MTYVVATDVGGTCTDAVIFGEGEPVGIGKALSTPPNFGEGVIASVENAARAKGLSLSDLFALTSLFVHGSTVVDNTILTGGGARTGLITTEGFEDTLHLTRGAYGRWGGLPEDLIRYPVATDRGEPLVDWENIRGIAERVDHKGDIVRPLDERAAEGAIRYLVEQRGVSAIAVSLLWSFYNPAHETKLRELIARLYPSAYVTLSHEIAPVMGEYERTSTTVINCYSGRITRDYLAGLRTLLEKAGYAGPMMVMQGYGGLLPAAEAGDRSVGMIECGPAAGIIGSKFWGELMGDHDIVAADMGGTTFKVGVVQGGQLEYAREPMIARYHYIAPKIDIVSIGAGGGSIISLDETMGIPKIGPRSAGARPGPVCYGQGGAESTLTDIMALIGYMSPETFLGGSVKLDFESARRVFADQIAAPMNMSVEEAAIGIYRIAAAKFADLISEITVERGLDTRDFVLHAFGGTGPMFCAMYGEELQVKRIVIPFTASVNCAFGLVSADIVHEYSTTKALAIPVDPDEINAIFAPMMERAQAQLADEGFTGRRAVMERSVDMRYNRQVHEVTTPLRQEGSITRDGLEDLANDFEALYERRFGKGAAYREAGIRMTTFRLSARGLTTRPHIEKLTLAGADSSSARTGRRDIFVDARDGMALADIYDFDRLRPGNVVVGPAVIHTPITTIVVQARQRARIDEYRNTIIGFD